MSVLHPVRAHRARRTRRQAARAAAEARHEAMWVRFWAAMHDATKTTTDGDAVHEGDTHA
ncbi:hypothetical protein F9L07_22725 [Pimelobacter simplex]|uniref:Uncharacterized protein n=1 Tax=Nocardioides simplex TaxID=2045 RepID=A0A7J5DT56_NOCSI|nr:hypothetical protein [Pimelobacter simplex]KAB2808333.1 hypothetical protein F9L07_22725 [Pimelobacter simplex]